MFTIRRCEYHQPDVTAIAANTSATLEVDGRSCLDAGN